ncbi:MAG: hypothetical protein EHM12_11355 [Dehalococcoidia bacterium]|nr:MAG: hypothetical protein EHM12_11355 [Dehalococcoidia bacterium]
MKNLFKSIIMIVVVFIASGYSAATSTIPTSYPYCIMDTAISYTTAFDTIATTGNITLVSKFIPDPGWEYILKKGILTGTNANSCYMQVLVICRDPKGIATDTVIVDSITSSTPENITIPIGQTVIGHSFDIVILGYGSNGAQIIFNRLYLWKRAVYDINKTWINK